MIALVGTGVWGYAAPRVPKPTGHRSTMLIVEDRMEGPIRLSARCLA
jgi:hypothetical protein